LLEVKRHMIKDICFKLNIYFPPHWHAGIQYLCGFCQNERSITNYMRQSTFLFIWVSLSNWLHLPSISVPLSQTMLTVSDWHQRCLAASVRSLSCSMRRASRTEHASPATCVRASLRFKIWRNTVSSVRNPLMLPFVSHMTYQKHEVLFLFASWNFRNCPLW